MRAIVCGGRDLTDGNYVFRSLDTLRETMGLSHVIEGGQRGRHPMGGRIDRGADYWAMRWAQARGLTFDTVKADWGKYGRSGGPLRNAKMLSEYEPECVIAFPGGNGTQDMADRAERARVPVVWIKPPTVNPSKEP